MIQVLRSLEEISSGYSVFEKDQVLTHQQLNSVADFLDDQSRLTRVKLVGVGIACGLRVSLQGSTAVVTKGAGVTTDGDLLYLNSATVFDQYKLYDESNPVYPPFYVDGTMLTVYELIKQGVTDPLATSLSQFAAQTGNQLSDMVAVMLMESYVRDPDLCSGTDCDNLGKDFITTGKLLLIEKTAVGVLQQNIATPHQAYGLLNPITADRPLIPATLTSLSQLAQIYRGVCNTIHNKLIIELNKVYPACSAFLGEVFAADPAPAWKAKLTTLNTTFASNDLGIQYYYDFLKDMVETYNDFRELLFGNTTWCCPDAESFPKHLLLGNLVPGLDTDKNRTLFYPSPIVSRTAAQLEHSQFLAQKLDTLIQTFQVPASASAAIRITPSLFEEQRLEERAIPYYYQVNLTNPIQNSWNYSLHQRGMDAYNYSYNASAYGAKGGAANPFGSQIGRFSFFRIEGQLGKNVSTVLAALESEIQSKNLPITVSSVMLGTDKTKIVKKPGIRYTDLHRFHYVLRQDAFYQLDDVLQFSGNFKQQVDSSVAGESDATALKNAAEQSNNTITGKAAAAQTKLNRSYSQYQADPSWKTDLTDTVQAAGEFKYNVGSVVKTEFTTPFDSLISTTQHQWLDWLDQIIKVKEDKDDDKLLFTHFTSRHPGIEHFAGVVRGGTLMLVYDSTNNVVADFMLPYYYEDTAEAEPDEPTLPKPGLKPGWIVDNGIKLLPSLDTFVRGKLDSFELEIEPIWNQRYNWQQQSFDFFKESINVMGNVFSNVQKTRASSGVTEKFTDAFLGMKVNEVNVNRQKVELLKQKAGQPGLPEEMRKAFTSQAKEAEAELAKSIQETAQYVSESGQGVATGSEGFQAMLEISNSLGMITDRRALKTVRDGLTAVSEKTRNADLRVLIGTMLKS